MVAVRSKTNRPFRRDGVAFSHEGWTILDSATERQKSDPSLQCVEIEGPDDRALATLPVLFGAELLVPKPEKKGK